MEKTSFGMKITMAADFDAAQEQVVAALKEKGFGVLTEINVQKTLKEKIDADFRRYMILGACNPNLAFKALSADGDVGLLLPCNVVLSEADSGTDVAIMKPSVISDLTGNAVVCEVADQAEAALAAALAELEGAGS